MLCVLEVLSLIYGIMTLVRGKFSLGKTKEVRGAPAYVIGVVLLATIPVAVVAAIILNFDEIMQGANGGPQFKLDAKTVLPDVIGVVGCWGTALIIAFIYAKPKVDDRYARSAAYDDEYDDEDEPPRRRRRHEDEFDRDEDRPRRRYEREDRAEDDDRRRRDDLDERAR